MTQKTANFSIYIVTVLDDADPERPLYQRTPGIFTNIDDAISAIKNNVKNISENGFNQYAVIEQTTINKIIPVIEHRMWFEWDATTETYQLTDSPAKFIKVVGFGIS